MIMFAWFILSIRYYNIAVIVIVVVVGLMRLQTMPVAMWTMRTELNNNCACARFWTIHWKRAFKTNMAACSSVLWTAFFCFGKVLVQWTTLEGSCLVSSLSPVLNARMKFMLMIVKARLKGEWIREICLKCRIFLQVPEHRLPISLCKTKEIKDRKQNNSK